MKTEPQGRKIELDSDISGLLKERIDPKYVQRYDTYTHTQRYKLALKKMHGLILDLGCGLGYGSNMLAEEENYVVASDASLECLKYAKSLYGCDRIEYILADARVLPFKDNSFAGITCFEVIEHLENGKKLLVEIHRTVRVDGTVALSTPNCTHLCNRFWHFLLKRPYPRNAVCPYHVWEYSFSELTSLISVAGLRITEEYGQILTFPFWLNIIVSAQKIKFDFIYRLIVKAGKPFPNLSYHMVFILTKS